MVGIIRIEQVFLLIQRALNLVDERLVDHGIRVAMIVNAMLEAEGMGNAEKRKQLGILALMHDIGAYRTEEIDQLVKFETESIWEHSVYGYLFLREFTPLGEMAKVVLYHHAGFGKFPGEPEEIMRFSQILFVADRVDVLMENGQGDLIRPKLRERVGNAFDPQVVDLFWKANQAYGLLDRLQGPIRMENVFDAGRLTAEEALEYLKLLVHVIDFRSHYTVTHTVNTMEISRQLAMRLGLSGPEVDRVYYGALMHDLGKIGIPLSILEKPGRLLPEEMEIMRRHVDMTAHIIAGVVEEHVVQIALRHHEKLDGTGYPRGYRAAELTVQQRIVAVADIISALCQSRSYKDAMPGEQVCAILDEMERAGQLDSEIVRLAEAEYDDIIAEAGMAGDPVLAAYDRINTEYSMLLGRLKYQERGAEDAI